MPDDIIRRLAAARLHLRARLAAAVSDAPRLLDGVAGAVTPGHLLQAVQDHRATTLMTGPTMYRAMAPLDRSLRPLEPAHLLLGRRAFAGAGI